MRLEKLKERYILLGEIAAETPLHVGRGRGEKDLGEADLPILKFPDERIYIPGSTLKGCLRSEVERILTQLGFRVCIYKQRREISPTYECNSENPCVSCEIFGSTRMGSRIIVRDAVSKEKNSSFRKGVALLRDTKTVDPKGPFEIEFAAPGTIFDMEIIIENPQKWMLGVIFTAMESLPAVGGQTSRGMGKVKININRIEKWTAESVIRQQPEMIYEGKELEEFVEGCKQEFRENIGMLKERYGGSS